MKNLINFFFLFYFFCSFSQSEKSQISYIQASENFILTKQKDSATYYINKLDKNDYSTLLRKINQEKTLSYKDFDTFLNRVSNRQSIKYNLISDFINNNIKEPKNEQKINSFYVHIKWVQVSKLRDEVGLEPANDAQKELEAYVNKFNIDDVDVLRAKTMITTHNIVLYNIERDMKGKELCLKSIQTARELKDVELEVTLIYFLTDFLIIEGKLLEYIDVSEKCLKLINDSGIKTSFYHSTIEHLLDAYIYKGGEEKRVKELLKTLYLDQDSKIYSYEYYLRFIAKLDKNSPQKNIIFNQFKVKNTLELVEKFRKLGKDLNKHDYQNLISSCATALVNQGFYKEGIAYKNKQVNLIKKIYSEDLSETLANHKTELAVKGKEIEIANEKEKVKIYSIVASLIGFFLIVSLLTIRKIRKQSRELSSKNKLIKKTLKEKELLVKEVHHRVKNNFQIVSSLLELQSKGIEDEKALELANEGKNRVKSMAIIHQKLYQNKNGLVDFDEYIQLLVKELTAIYDSKNKVKTSIETKNMKFDVDTAIPLGLIINEIITNSYKYAFDDNKENHLHISIDKNEKNDYKLIIEDNGPGISDQLNLKKVKSLGLRLINRLVKQLHGSVNLTNKNGARFEIIFKDIASRQLVD